MGVATSIGLALAGGAGIAAAARGNRDKVENSWLQNPEYPENTYAREEWKKRLEQWGADPNYGAVSPDWDNIWGTVQRRVKEYYDGGPLAPGVKDRIKSSLARRGMSENPASDALLARVDAEQGNQLSDMATQQGIAQANLAESGRKTWLESLMELESRKPQGQWQTTIKPDRTNQILGAVGNIGSAVAGYGMQNMAMQNQNNWLSALMADRGPSSYGTDWNPGASGYAKAADMRNSSLLPNRFSAWNMD